MANRGGDHDGQGEAGRPGGRPDPRGLDRAGGDAGDHRGPLQRPARRRPRVPGGRQRQGRRDAGNAPPRPQPVLPLLLPLGRGGLDTPGGGRRAGGAAPRGLTPPPAAGTYGPAATGGARTRSSAARELRTRQSTSRRGVRFRARLAGGVPKLNPSGCVLCGFEVAEEDGRWVLTEYPEIIASAGVPRAVNTVTKLGTRTEPGAATAAVRSSTTSPGRSGWRCRFRTPASRASGWTPHAR